jgi:hypothetical protein
LFSPGKATGGCQNKDRRFETLPNLDHRAKVESKGPVLWSSGQPPVSSLFATNPDDSSQFQAFQGRKKYFRPASRQSPAKASISCLPSSIFEFGRRA